MRCHGRRAGASQPALLVQSEAGPSFVLIRALAGLLLTAGLLGGAGCAYSFRAPLPDHLRRVRVPVFRNATPYTDLEVAVTREVITALGTDGSLRVVRSNADCLLHGVVVGYHRETLREDGLDDRVEGRVTLAARITFTDLTTGRRLFVDRVVTSRGTDESSGIFRLRRRETEGFARSSAAKDLGRAVARAVVEIWLEE